MTAESNNRHIRTRRNFLMGAVGVGGGIGAASFLRSFGLGVLEGANAEEAEHDVATIVNLATTAETLAATFYYTVLTDATFHIAEEPTEYLKLALDAELHHLAILEELGGHSFTQQFYLPQRVLSDASVFVNTGLRAETLFAGVYLAATHRFAALGQPRLAATTAQHAASEAQHITVIRHLAGLVPNDLTLPTPMFAHEDEALPALAPFIQGGAGFTQAVRFPNIGQYQSLLGSVGAVRSRSFVQG